LSKVRIEDIIIRNIFNLTNPLILVDQSELYLDLIRLLDTSSTSNLIEILSDSIFNATRLEIIRHKGPILNVQESVALMNDSKIEDIEYSALMGH
jgi:hypothetical protein